MPEPIETETIAPPSDAVNSAPPVEPQVDAVEAVEKEQAAFEAKKAQDREAQIALLKKMDGVDHAAAEPEKAVERTPDKPSGDAAAVEKTVEKTPEKPAETDEEYDGLGPKQLQHLKQAQVLPKPDEWKKLSTEERRTLLTSAREKISNSTREFEAQRRGTQPAPAVEPKTPSRADPAQPAEQAKPDEWLTKVQDLFGPDAAKLIDERLKKIEEKSVGETKTLREKLDAIESERFAQIQEKYKSQAREARKELSSELMGLDVDNDMHVDLFNRARVQFAARVQAGMKPNEIDFKDCYIDAAHLKYREEFLLTAQRKLTQVSKTAMAGSPVPAGKVASPTQGLAPRDRNVAILKALDEGKSVEEARRIA